MVKDQEIDDISLQSMDDVELNKSVEILSLRWEIVKPRVLCRPNHREYSNSQGNDPGKSWSIHIDVILKNRSGG